MIRDTSSDGTSNKKLTASSPSGGKSGLPSISSPAACIPDNAELIVPNKAL